MVDPENVGLEILVADLRAGSEDDVAFAKRIALVCIELADRYATVPDPAIGAAIRDVFRVDEEPRRT